MLTIRSFSNNDEDFNLPQDMARERKLETPIKSIYEAFGEEDKLRCFKKFPLLILDSTILNDEIRETCLGDPLIITSEILDLFEKKNVTVFRQKPEFLKWSVYRLYDSSPHKLTLFFNAYQIPTRTQILGKLVIYSVMGHETWSCNEFFNGKVRDRPLGELVTILSELMHKNFTITNDGEFFAIHKLLRLDIERRRNFDLLATKDHIANTAFRYI